MGNVVDLKGRPIDFADNTEFVTDFARFSEGLVSEKVLRRKYKFDDATWEKLGSDDALVAAIEDEKIRRMRSGASRRERAQLHVMAAPDVAARIMLDDGANARHRLDACKVLDDFSANGPTAVATQDRFIITINLGSDADGKQIVETYNKSITIDADDTPPVHTPPLYTAPAAQDTPIAATPKRPRGRPRKNAAPIDSNGIAPTAPDRIDFFAE
jgi:hypothetical protein